MIRAYPIFRVLALALLLTPLLAVAETAEFPGRKIYPDVSVITLAHFKARRHEVLVVDVRSAYEYQTLHITGAINIPLADERFAGRLANLRAENAKDIIVYCNGKTCMKSYKAARKCAEANISNVYAYDAGIMDWARAYPGAAELLGEMLGDPGKLISKDDFSRRLLDPGAFGERVASSNAYVLDVRDSFQRDALGLFPGRERRVVLDNSEKLDRYIYQGLREGREFLIYDAAGKQVRWLQYYLESKGVHKYYFMAGGARAYYKEMTDEFLAR
ncbi:hypothetical protein MNBD_GAMMA20-2112 [hydrothermal vent metagenome]|uniref:Rhodanese domain-containing protein n=1 Tax=hydrothermal vent metagenome TaxID=652676 RepID=A0A3B1AB60_9ZZZZ